ncbi:hypothetical protein SUGI_0000420 [Cryptomeria japonica]|nr:hypothetical protein SUGI_0000420 [Cryptomeria japonica]
MAEKRIYYHLGMSRRTKKRDEFQKAKHHESLKDLFGSHGSLAQLMEKEKYGSLQRLAKSTESSEDRSKEQQKLLYKSGSLKNEEKHSSHCKWILISKYIRGTLCSFDCRVK